MLKELRFCFLILSSTKKMANSASLLYDQLKVEFFFYNAHFFIFFRWSYQTHNDSLQVAEPFFLFAGPNVIESEEHVLRMAKSIKDISTKYV